MKQSITLFAIVILLSNSSLTIGQAGSAKGLFGAYGSIGLVPRNPPPGFESEFAVAVVEIDSPKAVEKLAVSDFELVDSGGRTTKFKRVVSAEVFDRARTTAEGECAYWLNPGGTRPWNGELPSGKIQLRVRVALAMAPPKWDGGSTFKVTIGPHVITGRVDCVWPS